MWLWTQVIFLFTINIARENMHEYLTIDMNLKKIKTTAVIFTIYYRAIHIAQSGYCSRDNLLVI